MQKNIERHCIALGHQTLVLNATADALVVSEVYAPTAQYTKPVSASTLAAPQPPGLCKHVVFLVTLGLCSQSGAHQAVRALRRDRNAIAKWWVLDGAREKRAVGQNLRRPHTGEASIRWLALRYPRGPVCPEHGVHVHHRDNECRRRGQPGGSKTADRVVLKHKLSQVVNADQEMIEPMPDNTKNVTRPRVVFEHKHLYARITALRQSRSIFLRARQVTATAQPLPAPPRARRGVRCRAHGRIGITYARAHGIADILGACAAAIFYMLAQHAHSNIRRGRQAARPSYTVETDEF